MDINVDRLHKELNAALEADRRYSRENDAKFRALDQKVGSYEEFRDIVKASHLQPLDREDIMGSGRRIQPWNMIASRTSQDDEAGRCGCLTQAAPPKTEQEFLRQWRQYKDNTLQQYRLVVDGGTNQLPQILQGGICMTIFGELVQVLNNHYHDSDAAHIATILTILSQMPQFSLSIGLLNRNERAAVDELFSKLVNAMEVEKESKLLGLMNTYKVGH